MWRWADEDNSIDGVKRTYRRDSRGRFAGGGGGSSGGKGPGGKGKARTFANRKQRNADGSLSKTERARLEAELRYRQDPWRGQDSYGKQRIAEIQAALAGKSWRWADDSAIKADASGSGTPRPAHGGASPDETTDKSQYSGNSPEARSARARHAALVRYGKENPVQARLAKIRQAKAKKGKGGGGAKPKPVDPVAAARQAKLDREHDEDRAMRLADRQARLDRQAERDKAAAEPPAAKPEKPKKGGGGGGGGGKEKPPEPSAEDKEKAKADAAAAREKATLARQAARDKVVDERIAARDKARQAERDKAQAARDKAKADADAQELDDLADDYRAKRKGLSLKDQHRLVKAGRATFDKDGNFTLSATKTWRWAVKAEADTQTPPAAVQAAARRALERRAKAPPSQRGMTPVGLARARDLSGGRPVSVETARRMVNYFTRHQKDKQGATWGDYGPGRQAWDGWGGDAGWRWARGVVARADSATKETHE